MERFLGLVWRVLDGQAERTWVTRGLHEMDDLSPFTAHFARLVWLNAHRPDDQEGLKDELRHTLAQLSSEPGRLVLHEISMAVSNVVMREASALGSPAGGDPEELAWFADLSVRMASHSVRALEFDVATPAREVMALAQALVSAPTPSDGGTAFDMKLLALALTGVTAHLGPEGFVRRAITHMPSSSSPMHTPVRAMTAYVPPEAPGRFGPGAATAAGHNGNDGSPSQRMMQDQLLPRSSMDAPLEELLASLDEATVKPQNANAVVDDVTRVVEDRALRGKPIDLVQVLKKLHEQHDRQHDGDVKRAFLMGIRRLEKPAILHGLVRLLPDHRELRAEVTDLLSRAGEAGADALIEGLITSEVTSERRAFRDALAHCPAATGALTHLLNDERWYVIRNAVELLSELAPGDIEVRRVAVLLSHREPRVRQAAAIALGKLSTSQSLLALLQGLSDESPDVRLQAALGLGRANNPRAVPWLLEAFDTEQDPDVRLALVAALGNTPTEDAVARLIRLAEPGGVLLRKPVSVRVRAVEALGAAGTPAAVQALRGLLDDRDQEVRDSAKQVVGRIRQSA